ncbi:hypothetical protein [Paraflavitalea sp. CAU 1676]|uniref:hypothetical protein n=1 Tax=Paraflavitalea sp. CAU 1676 TaxID=3032598 RepID=UPI0023DB96C8|nr:hypothetical protein [Paraflavitalea sp. CAU 1676]MDF2190760.1 hypothetical protein [Paraflavitalea sp. CAU 1676]
MKKIITLAMVAFLVSGVAFAHEGGGKKCGKDKKCSKKEAKACCKKENKSKKA